jgi:DHA1 family tetracycline resistance protein-like MFS transporter
MQILMAQSKRRLPVLFIFFTVVLDSMGIGIIMPVMPDLLREVANTDLSNAAIWGGILSAIFAVNQFIFSPTLGSLSDRFGRRPVLLISLFVMTIDYLVMAVAGSMALLVIARIVGGITAATQSIANAYMADISSEEEKAQNFGLLGAAFGVGFILGPLLGGLLSGYGSRAPFYAAAALTGLNLLFGWLVLPETVTDKTRRAFDWRRANPLGAFRQLKRLPGMLPLLLAFMLINMAFFVYPAVWAYYGRAQFGWDGGMVGLSLAAYGLGVVLVQGGLIRFAIPAMGENHTVMLGMLVHLLSFSVYPLFSQTWQVFAFMPIGVLSAMTVPALQGLMSNAVPANAQGELQGAMSSLVAIATILSPLVMTRTFSYFTADDAPFYLPGAPFVVAAFLTMAAMTVIIRYRQSA